jgi:3-isopropylmalate dehydrogenase
MKYIPGGIAKLPEDAELKDHEAEGGDRRRAHACVLFSRAVKAMRIAVVPGDGIGVDVTSEAMKVLAAAARAATIGVATTEFPWSADHYLKTGESLPKGGFDDLRANYDAIFMGAFGDPRVPDMAHARDILLGARFVLDLYVNARPIRCLDERLNPLKGFRASDIDFTIFRENTEGSYAGTGGNFKKGTPDEVALQEDISTRKGVERIIRHAFAHAKAHGKTKVCMSDKSNAMRFVGDLWQRTFQEVAREYPEIEASHLYVDALVMQMVKDPAQFEVVVTNNMFGDITTDLGAALQGGLGMAASGNIHPGRISMFEPVHGSAPKYAGTGKANPFGAILTIAMMLDHLDAPEPARAIEAAVQRCVAERQCTHDVGGSLTTSQAGDAVVERLN